MPAQETPAPVVTPGWAAALPSYEGLHQLKIPERTEPKRIRLRRNFTATQDDAVLEKSMHARVLHVITIMEWCAQRTITSGVHHEGPR